MYGLLGMGLWFFFVLGLLVGLLWHGFAGWKGPSHVHAVADMFLGALGSILGAFFSALFQSQQQMFVIWPISVALAIAFGLALPITAWWIARIPADA